ncbi:MAG: hypothetical protein U1F67_10180 [Rubrivivax sp.]
MAAARDELKRLVALPEPEGRRSSARPTSASLLQRRAGRANEARAALKATIAASRPSAWPASAVQRLVLPGAQPHRRRAGAACRRAGGAAAQATALKALRAEVAARHAEQPDWSAVAFIGRPVRKRDEQRLAARLEGLLAAFADVQRRCADASR